MYLKDVTQEQLTEFFINDPELCYLGLDDDTLSHLYHNKEYLMSPVSFYQGVFKDDVLAAVMKFEKFSELAVNCHMYLSSKYRSKGFGKEFKEAVYKYVVETTTCTKALMMAPDPCNHVKRAAKSWGFIQEGKLTNCIIWRTKTVDLYIYALDIKR